SCANGVLFESILLANDRQNGFHTVQTQGGHLWKLLDQPNVRVRQEQGDIVVSKRRAGSHSNSRCYRRGFRSRIRSKPAFIAAKRASTIGSNSVSVKIYAQSFSIPSRTSSPTYCGSTPFNTRSWIIWNGADERIAFRVCSLGRGKRAGRFLRESIILVRTKPGQRTETPIP